MATRTADQAATITQPLVKITEMDHIVLRCQDVERSLRFYSEALGLRIERVEEWRAGKVRFPSVRLNADTIIDLFVTDQPPIATDAPRNQDHFCMVIEPQDMNQLRARFEAIGVKIQTGPGKRWGAHGDGISLYIYDPDDNVVELRHY
jgi:catechol 2,3-dioxygenase-like lactoylglutathione lyase family enzyme